MLRTVFLTTEEKVIRLTLQKLPVQYVGALANELTTLSQKKTTKLVLFCKNSKNLHYLI